MTYSLVMLVLVSRCTYLNDICLIKTGHFLRAENIHLQNIKCSSVVTMNNTVIIWRSYYYQKQLFIVFTPTPISYCEYEKCPISKKNYKSSRRDWRLSWDYFCQKQINNMFTNCGQFQRLQSLLCGHFISWWAYYNTFRTVRLNMYVNSEKVFNTKENL